MVLHFNLKFYLLFQYPSICPGLKPQVRLLFTLVTIMFIISYIVVSAYGQSLVSNNYSCSCSMLYTSDKLVVVLCGDFLKSFILLCDLKQTLAKSSVSDCAC